MRLLRSFLIISVLSVATIFMFNSCVNSDTYILDDYNYGNWRYELSNMISDFEVVLDNSNVSFESAKPYHGKVDSLLFLSDENSFFPVSYRGLDNYFEIKPKSFIQKDTCTIHMPYFVIKNMVSYITEKGDSIDLIKVNWVIDGEKKQSIAAFNKFTGEFLYDNVLFNIPWFFSSVKQTSKLTKSGDTGGNGGSSGGNGSGSGTYTKNMSVLRDDLSVTYDMNSYKLKIDITCRVTYNSNGTVRSYDPGSFNCICSIEYPEYFYGYTTENHEWIFTNGSGITKDFYCYLAVFDPSYSEYYDVFCGSPVYNCQMAVELGSNSFLGGLYKSYKINMYAYLFQFFDTEAPYFQER